MKPLECTASIVTYKNPPMMIRNAIESIFSEKPDVELHIVDNSPTQALRSSLVDTPVKYHFNGCNVGYGRGHNVAISACSESKYHIVINPDIVVIPPAIHTLSSFMDRNPDIGMVCPRVVGPDGAIQHLNKRYPTLLDLFIRRFSPPIVASLLKKRLDAYEMKDKGYDSVCDVESMTGAFMFCRRDVLERTGGFDPRYFMYFEDFDLSRQFQQFGYRTVYCPLATVTHLWERAAHKSLRMTFVFMINMFRYFHKWGWKVY
jgi:GT2 family glycosyltransferase